VENESREHGQAMFVLFSYGAVKHGDGRNHFSEKNTKQNQKKDGCSFGRRQRAL